MQYSSVRASTPKIGILLAAALTTCGLLLASVGPADAAPPVTANDSNTIKEDASPHTVTGNVLTNDSDPDGHTLSVINTGIVTLTYGSLQIHADGTYTYTLDNSNPAVNALNTGQHLTETFTYVASDGHGGTTYASLSIRIDGTTDNRPPVTANDTNSIQEDAAPHTITGNVLTNDTDPDGHALSVVNAGTVSLNYGSLEIHADGTYTYTLDNSNPAVNALNTGQHLTDTFTYAASDGHGEITQATLTVTINGSGAIASYTVKFDSTGGSSVPQAQVAAGSLLAEPDDPTRIGHTFTGWFADPSATSAPYDFSTPVTGDLVLYAGWQATAVVDDPGTDTGPDTDPDEGNGTGDDNDSDQQGNDSADEDDSALPDTGGPHLWLGLLAGGLLILGPTLIVTTRRRRTATSL